jgi:6-phosphofructokinase 1
LTTVYPEDILAKADHFAQVDANGVIKPF